MSRACFQTSKMEMPTAWTSIKISTLLPILLQSGLSQPQDSSQEGLLRDYEGQGRGRESRKPSPWKKKTNMRGKTRRQTSRKVKGVQPVLYFFYMHVTCRTQRISTKEMGGISDIVVYTMHSFPTISMVILPLECLRTTAKPNFESLMTSFPCSSPPRLDVLLLDRADGQHVAAQTPAHAPRDRINIEDGGLPVTFNTLANDCYTTPCTLTKIRRSPHTHGLVL
jgi:hypothetical protein